MTKQSVFKCRDLSLSVKFNDRSVEGKVAFPQQTEHLPSKSAIAPMSEIRTGSWDKSHLKSDFLRFLSFVASIRDIFSSIYIELLSWSLWAYSRFWKCAPEEFAGCLADHELRPKQMHDVILLWLVMEEIWSVRGRKKSCCSPTERCKMEGDIYHPGNPVYNIPSTPAGLEAIYKLCRRLYPTQPNPLQVTAVVKYWWVTLWHGKLHLCVKESLWALLVCSPEFVRKICPGLLCAKRTLSLNPIQSSSFETIYVVSFPPPPPNGDVGWRVSVQTCLLSLSGPAQPTGLVLVHVSVLKLWLHKLLPTMLRRGLNFGKGGCR